MAWTKPRFAPRSRSATSRPFAMASPMTRWPRCMSDSSWRIDIRGCEDAMQAMKIALAVLLLAGAGLAQTPSAQNTTVDQVVDRVVQQEAAFMDSLQAYRPLVETYIQETRADKELGTVPERDHYFLTKADFSQGIRDRVFIGAGNNTEHHRLAVFSKLLPSSSPFGMKFVEA